MINFTTIKEFDNRLIRGVYRWLIDDRPLSIILSEFTVETRQTTRHKWKIDARWTRRPLRHYETIGIRKIDLDELQSKFIPDDVKEWVGVSMIVEMNVEIKELPR